MSGQEIASLSKNRRSLKSDQFVRHGKRGYRAVMETITRIADYLANALKTLGFLVLR